MPFRVPLEFVDISVRSSATTLDLLLQYRHWLADELALSDVALVLLTKPTSKEQFYGEETRPTQEEPR